MKLTKPSNLLACIALCSFASLSIASTATSANINDAQKAEDAYRPSHGEPGVDTALVAFFGGTHDCKALLGAEGQSGDGLDPVVSGRLAAVLDATAAKGTKTIDTLNMLRATCAHHQN